MSPPLVSVVIPNHNCARFLPEALESVFAQTYANLEILIVDDGSTDDSAQILERYTGGQESPEWTGAQRPPEGSGGQGPPEEIVGQGPPEGTGGLGPPEEIVGQGPPEGSGGQGPPEEEILGQGPPRGTPRVRVLRQAHQGVSAARNLGIRESRGELVAFLDADDLWHPEKLAKQVALFANPAVGLVHCAVEYIDEQGRSLGTNFTGRRGRVLRPIALLQGTVVLAGGSTAVVRREAFEKAGGFDCEMSTAADWDMWRRLACYYEIDVVREPLIRYRLRPRSMHRNLAVFEHDMLHGFSSMFADPAAAEVHGLRRRADAALYLMLAGSFLHAREWRKCLAYGWRSLIEWPPSVTYVAALPLRRAQRRLFGHEGEPSACGPREALAGSEAKPSRRARASDSLEPLRGASAPSNSGGGGVPAATSSGGVPASIRK